MLISQFVFPRDHRYQGLLISIFRLSVVIVCFYQGTIYVVYSLYTHDEGRGTQRETGIVVIIAVTYPKLGLIKFD
jgi:hypothetical protein